jgi:hypothetical protein
MEFQAIGKEFMMQPTASVQGRVAFLAVAIWQVNSPVFSNKMYRERVIKWCHSLVLLFTEIEAIYR